MKRGRQPGADILPPTTDISHLESARLSALVRELRQQLAVERKLRHQLKMKVLAVLRDEGAAKSATPKPSRAR
jgi:hypothetical protein